MSCTLPVELRSGRLDRLPTELLVVPFFEGERPLRGPLAHVDWRSCGLVSEQIGAGRVAGHPGEVLLLPGGGPLLAERILALGLGPRPGFAEPGLVAAGRLALERSRALRVGQMLFALPDERVTGIPLDRAASAVVEGVAERLAAAPCAIRLALHLPVLAGTRVRESLATRFAANASPIPAVKVALVAASADRHARDVAPQGGAGPRTNVPIGPRPS